MVSQEQFRGQKVSQLLARREDGKFKSFLNPLMDINLRHRLELPYTVVRMVAAGYQEMRSSWNLPHSAPHYEDMLQDTDAVLTLYPSLRPKVDWQVYFGTFGWHDIAISRRKPNLRNLIVEQFFEHRVAVPPALHYMQTHNVSSDLREKIAKLIYVHPFDPRHKTRMKLEGQMDERLRMTSKLFYVIDSGNAFAKSRIDRSMEHLRRSVGGLTDPLMPFFLWYVKRYSGFMFDLGAEYPKIREMMEERKKTGLEYIDKLYRHVIGKS